MIQLAQPLLRPGPSTPPALAVQALPEARPRFAASEPEPINPMRLTAWDDTHAASPVSTDEYLDVTRDRRKRADADASPDNQKNVPVIDVITGKQFAGSVAEAARHLRVDQYYLGKRLRGKPVVVVGKHTLRLDSPPPSPSSATSSNESTASPDQEESDE